MTDKAYWVALAMINGIGPRTFAALVKAFGSPNRVFEATEEELSGVARLTPEVAAQIRATDIDRMESELYALGEENITVITLEDEEYPVNLAQIPDAPAVLFMRGILRAKDEHAVAIVGTREPSEWGRTMASQLAMGLVEHGFTIVSGLARGIDTSAHTGALDGEGRTLAVLGSGIRVVHPRENVRLANKIADAHGAVLSEFHPNAPPKGPALMSRDRIISGLARGVIVVEAATDSGSLDTASRARKQGRLVFAVQGGGAGTEALIRGGAQVIHAENIGWDRMVEALESWTMEAKQEPSKQIPLL
jgi:DNA processing protein